MAVTYGPERSAVSAWSSYARAALSVNSSKSATSVTYSYFGCLQMYNYEGCPYQAIDVNGWTNSGYATGSYPGSNQWYNSGNFQHSSGNITVNRNHNSKTITIKVKCTCDGGYFQAYDGQRYINPYVSETSQSISIPALDSYTVSYDKNGGTSSPTSQTKWYGENLTLTTSIPYRQNYAFLGWATSKANADAGIIAYSSGSIYTANAPITLYAVWKRLGSIRIKNSDAWKMSMPYVKVNGVWKPSIAFSKQNGSWKEGV